ncbi:hypothetical protein JCM19047_4030 [Bacillus sp. JCM 19047]|nr:hypothetical protein JCM19047_4030 [Bacillus sp. JCM 19047]
MAKKDDYHDFKNVEASHQYIVPEATPEGLTVHPFIKILQLKINQHRGKRISENTVLLTTMTKTNTLISHENIQAITQPMMNKMYKLVG